MIEKYRDDDVRNHGRECFEIDTFPRLSHSRAPDWGHEVTVCIAAICREGIVMATDMMISMGWVSSDSKTGKSLILRDRWYAMYSGDDLSSVEPILEGVRGRLATAASSVSAVKDAFRKSYQEQLQQEATDQVLARYGWTLESFLRDGYNSLGQQSHAKILGEYERVKLDCQFLVCGLDSRNKGHIFSVSNPGIIRDHSQIGFWSIGTGEYMALSSLMSHEIYMASQDIEEVAYYVCEAKFMAEYAPQVGKTTVFFARKIVPNAEDEFAFMMGQGLLPIKSAWQSWMKSITPEKMKEIIIPCLEWESIKRESIARRPE